MKTPIKSTDPIDEILSQTGSSDRGFSFSDSTSEGAKHHRRSHRYSRISPGYPSERLERAHYTPHSARTAVVNLAAHGWRLNIDKLSATSGVEVVDYHTYIRALEQRRDCFRGLGAVASDHAVLTPPPLASSARTKLM